MRLWSAPEPFDAPDIVAELKWDGWRGVIDGTLNQIYSRKATSLTSRFPELWPILARMTKRRIILDGEIVALVDGVPSFVALCSRTALATFVAFDVLSVGGLSTVDLPLEERRELLKTIVPRDSARLIRSRGFASGVQLFAEAQRRGLEGIVLKRLSSRYTQGPKRTKDWVKVKTVAGRETEAVRTQTWARARIDP